MMQSHVALMDMRAHTLHAHCLSLNHSLPHYITHTYLIILTLYPASKQLTYAMQGSTQMPILYYYWLALRLNLLLLTLELKGCSLIITAIISVGLECLHTLE